MPPAYVEAIRAIRKLEIVVAAIRYQVVTRGADTLNEALVWLRDWSNPAFPETSRTGIQVYAEISGDSQLWPLLLGMSQVNTGFYFGRDGDISAGKLAIDCDFGNWPFCC